jgi:hypothetical protein
MYLENQSVSDIGLPEFHVHDGYFSPLNQLMRLVAQEYFYYTMSP